MWTKNFWTDACERALKTLAQVLGASLIVGAPIFEQPWGTAAGIAATAAVGSLLWSIGGEKVADVKRNRAES